MYGSRFLCITIATSLLSTVTLAADLPTTSPPAISTPAPAEFSGWYLRGDIGLSNQQVRNLDNALYYTSGTTVQHQGLGFDSASVFGIGVGYQFNNWLRGDLTGEYRGKANFHGTDIVYFNGSPSSTNTYTASASGWLMLANVYADLGTWWCITPFVGAGVGMARNTISSFTDVGTQTGSTAFGNEASTWNFAWALHAGLAYKASRNLTVEVAYRYADLGNARSGDEYTYDGTNSVYNPMEFKHITSHDLRLGVRWSLDPTPVYEPRTLITKN